MDSKLFDYTLPEELIAQSPAARRDGSRLLLVDRHTRRISHHEFSEFADLLPQRSVLFRNNVSVLKARLLAMRPSGGKVECLLLHPHNRAEGVWWCLLRPGRKLGTGAIFACPGEFDAEVLEKSQRGEYLVQFRPMQNSPDPVEAIADRVGSVPLPPYIQRPVEGKAQLDDEQRYQTVYADPAKKWAAAAPTAGLHFTDKSLNELGRRNIPTYDLTLRIGLGTFRPIAVANVESHAIHTERYSIPASSVQALIAETTRPVVAVGTTTVRAIEDFARKSATAQPSGTHPPTEEFSSDASLYIYPPDTFHLTDALLTNFHLPRSTLMCLVAAFLTPGEVEGINWLKEIYRQAIRFKYRFYSYGDAMFIR